MVWEGNGTPSTALNGYQTINVGRYFLTPNNYHNTYPNLSDGYDSWVPGRLPRSWAPAC